MMLMSQAFEKLLQSWDSGRLPSLHKELIHTRNPLTLFQAMVTTLQTQSLDGSWGLRQPSREITAYAILILKALVAIPWLMHFAGEIHWAINRASEYLISTREQWGIDDYIWIGKTTYALPPVSRAYCLAALCANKSFTWSKGTEQLAVLPFDKIAKLSKFFANLPMFSNDKRWMLEAAVTEGFFWLPQLVRIRSDVFPYDDLTKYKYLEYIPFTWIATNRRNGSPLSNKTLWELMSVALLLHQLDEFMESAVCSQEQLKEIERVKELVKRLCTCPRHDEADSPGNRYTVTHNSSGDELCTKDVSTSRFAADNAPPNAHEERNNQLSHEKVTNGLHSQMTNIESTITHFTSRILAHPAVVQSPSHIRLHLHQQLECYILAHIAHGEANARFASEQHSTSSLHDNHDAQNLPTIKTFPALQLDYYTWTTAVSARDIGCSFMYNLFTILASPNPSQPFFQGAKQRWYSARADHHLAVMCRQYNDYGSLARDATEWNLNSLNFAEFHEGQSGSRDEAAMKADLFAIAEFERESLDHAMRKLDGELKGTEKGAWKMDALRVFVDTADLYGQLYVARDISPRVK